MSPCVASIPEGTGISFYEFPTPGGDFGDYIGGNSDGSIWQDDSDLTGAYVYGYGATSGEEMSAFIESVPSGSVFDFLSLNITCRVRFDAGNDAANPVDARTAYVRLMIDAGLTEAVAAVPLVASSLGVTEEVTLTITDADFAPGYSLADWAAAMSSPVSGQFRIYMAPPAINVNNRLDVYEVTVAPLCPAHGVDTSGLCELGCGTHRLIITDRCGARQICELTDDLSALEYGRVMDDTSEAIATVALTGGAGSECCDCVGKTHSWIHAGVIYRNEELVWGPGPVTNVLEQRGTAKITIKDVTAWLDRRAVHGDYDFVQTDIVQIAVALITDAMAPDDPCDIIGNLQVLGEGTLIDFTIEGGRIMAGDALRDLARIGLDFTAVGNSILLAPSLAFGPFTTLTDGDFQTDIEVEERGEDAATKWYVTGEAVSGSCGGIDPYYGLLEQVAQEDNVIDTGAADTAACSRLEASNPAPVYVNIPEGAQLSSKAPVCFEQLVPGVLMNVDLTETCRPVAITNRLTAMKVTAAGGEEQVGVTLAPLGTNADETSGGGDF